MDADNNVWWKHQIEDAHAQGYHKRACNYSWERVISELYNSGRGKHNKPIVNLLRAENVEVRGKREKQKDFYACISLLRETGNESQEKNVFWTHHTVRLVNTQKNIKKIP